MPRQPLTFEEHLAESWPPDQWQDVTVLVAVSGGADSVALLRGLKALKTAGRGRLAVAHFNHGLRGQESDADEALVVSLAAELDLRCEVGRGDVQAQAADLGDGLEAAARQARHAFLQDTAERLGARYVATAHTADDQAETVLHRIVRGTGLTGLAGIPRARKLGGFASLIRPLLPLRRQEVIEYLAELGQPFREDASNADRRFTRNRIRHELLPLLASQHNPEVVEALLRLSSLAADAQRAIEGIVEPLVKTAVAELPDGSVRVDCQQLSNQPQHLVREVLLAAWRQRNWPEQSMGLAEWNSLARQVQAPTSDKPTRQTLPGSILAERTGRFLLLSCR